MHTGSVKFGDSLPLDMPDPAFASAARVRELPLPVMDLVPQPAVTRLTVASFAESIGMAGREDVSVSFSYTLWRYPDDRSDPRNEIELDERTRRSIEEEPPWGRPAWLVEQAQLFRYPMLWEAVRTAWHAAPDAERDSLAAQLVDHANHVLRNQFRRELGRPAGPGGGNDGMVTAAAVAPSTVRVDGSDLAAIHIDTDPFVYAVGFRIDEQVVCTTVIPRDSLPLVDLALTTYRA